MLSYTEAGKFHKEIGIQPKKISFEELNKAVELAKTGDDEAYKKLLSFFITEISFLARKYFINGADYEDVYQECFIALTKAVETYDKNRGKFVPFANLCMESYIKTCVSKQNAQKRSFSEKMASLDNDPEYTYNGGVKIYGLRNQINPKDLPSKVLEDEFNKDIHVALREFLSKKESIIFYMRYIEDLPMRDISIRCRIDEKSVDNALHRIRMKIKKIGAEKISKILEIEPTMFPFRCLTYHAYRHPGEYTEYDPDGFGFWSHGVKAMEL